MSPDSCSWEELRGLSLARQFPDVGGRRDAAAVAEAVAVTGPIQSQTARSPYVGLGARLPGVPHAAVTQAYESHELVRGSSIRGTVHTSTARHHALLEAATRVGQRTLWMRLLQLDHTELDEVWAAIEGHAGETWRTPDELGRFLAGWLAERGEHDAVARLEAEGGRYLTFGHGGLLRRPLRGDWSSQGTPGYRSATAVLPHREVPAEPLLELVRLHLAAYGPSSRHDVAWWSGLGLRQIDPLLERLDPVWRVGPDGRSYADLPDAPAPRELPGVRLLPEFDAVLCGYDPKARERFVSPADNAVLWHRANGFMLAPVLLDGRVGGHWRLTGPERVRSLEVTLLGGARRPRRGELDEPVAALGSALDVSVSAVSVIRG